MTPDPCESCDFIGPLDVHEQPARDLHRAWHELQHTWHRAVAPIVAAFRSANYAARESTQAMYALTPHLPDQEDTMTRRNIDPARIEPDDTVTLRGTHGAIVGARAVRYHPEWACESDGMPVRALEIHPAIVLLLDGRDPWTVTEHAPAMPELVVGARYEITTDRDETTYATWEPIDGTRANHPWLIENTPDTRYRQDYVVRARPAPAEDNVL